MMKTALFLFAAALILSACSREQVSGQLSADQRTAVQKMEASYQQAKAYNDSLISARNGNLGSALITYYDNRYHQHEAVFTTTHTGYQHTTTSANHSHNGQGMVEMHNSAGGMMSGGGMMGSGECQCCTNGGHSASLHDQMGTLHQVHAQHHP